MEKYYKILKNLIFIIKEICETNHISYEVLNQNSIRIIHKETDHESIMNLINEQLDLPSILFYLFTSVVTNYQEVLLTVKIDLDT